MGGEVVRDSFTPFLKSTAMLFPAVKISGLRMLDRLVGCVCKMDVFRSLLASFSFRILAI